MRLRETAFLLGPAFHRLAWTEWGDPAAPPVVCVHGLTRNGRDFDLLAQALAAEYRVVAPDLPGRGASGWLPSPEDYAPAAYVQALSHLLAVLDREVAWIGTSLGGICGMLLAAAPGTPVRRLVLNDVGPFIPAAAVARIGEYLQAQPASFADLPALEAHLRRVHAPFGALTDAQWAAMAQHSARPLPQGGLALHYDPAIVAPFLAGGAQDVDLWPVWSHIAVPRLVLRGEHSDLLLPETLHRMAQSGAHTHTVPGCGHAPALVDRPTIEAIAAFLRG